MNPGVIAATAALSLFFSTSSLPRESGEAQRKSSSGHRTAWLGVSLRDLTPELAKEKGIKADEGAFVDDVTEDSPAEKAGIKPDDAIVSFNDRQIGDAADLRRAVQKADPGSTASVILLRKDSKQTLQVTLGTRPRQTWGFRFPENFPFPGRVHVFRSLNLDGLHLMDLTKQLGEYFGAPEGHGALVTEVGENSAAEKAGFKAGDVIVKIESERVEGSDDVWDALDEHRSGDTLAVDIFRKGSPLTLTMEVSGGNHNEWFKFRSEYEPFDIDAHARDHMVFESEKFKEEMKELGEKAKEAAKKMRIEMEDLGKQLRSEISNMSI